MNLLLLKVVISVLGQAWVTASFSLYLGLKSHSLYACLLAVLFCTYLWPFRAGPVPLQCDSFPRPWRMQVCPLSLLLSSSFSQSSLHAGIPYPSIHCLLNGFTPISLQCEVSCIDYPACSMFCFCQWHWHESHLSTTSTLTTSPWWSLGVCFKCFSQTTFSAFQYFRTDVATPAYFLETPSLKNLSFYFPLWLEILSLYHSMHFSLS